MVLTLKTKKAKLLHRLKIIRGQLSTIIKMVDQDAYCIKILNNSRSVQKALKQVDMLIMEDHLKHCAVDQARSGQTAKLVRELIEIYKYK